MWSFLVGATEPAVQGYDLIDNAANRPPYKTDFARALVWRLLPPGCRGASCVDSVPGLQCDYALKGRMHGRNRGVVAETLGGQQDAVSARVGLFLEHGPELPYACSSDIGIS